MHEHLHQIISAVVSKTENPDDKFHETSLANGIFLQNGFPIKDSYLQSTKKYYDSVAKNVDFRGKPQESTNVINR